MTPSTSSNTAVAPDEWMSLRKASLALEESRQAVLQRIVGGELRAKKIDDRTMVNRDDVARVKKQKDKAKEK